MTEQFYAPPSRRQYQPVSSRDTAQNSFDLFDHTPHNRQAPPPPPPNRQSQLQPQQPPFSSNNPFRRAPPPPTPHQQPQNVTIFPEGANSPFQSSFGPSPTATTDVNAHRYIQAAKAADPSFRSHSASNLEQRSRPQQQHQPQTQNPVPRNQVYTNPQFSSSDQSVFRAPPPQQPRRKDVPSFVSHSSNESTSSMTSTR